MLFIFSSPPFYTNHVKLPNEHDPIPQKYSTTQNSMIISRMLWVLLMEVKLYLHPLHIFVNSTGTERAIYLKTVSLPVDFLFNSAMLLQDGKAQQLTLTYGMMLSIMTLWPQKESITWQMQGFLHVNSSYYHTEVYAIILQSGVVLIYGM